MPRFVTSSPSQRREVVTRFANTDCEPISAEQAHREKMLCACVMETLQRFYPGHVWGVGIGGGKWDERRQKRQPMGIKISIPILMNNKFWIIPVAELMRSENHATALIKEAGGAILEAFNIPRSGFALDPFLIARRDALRPGARPQLPE